MTPPIVSHAEWLEARRSFLVKEKELTRLSDQLAKERQELPWEHIRENYVFDGPVGKVTLSDLFDGRSQLIIQHFMLGPGWTEGCVGCSFMADHIGGALPHLNHHDVTFAAVSRAPMPTISAFRKRMGWTFPWVSSGNNDFNFDYFVSFKDKENVYYNYETIKTGESELPGMSVFYKDEHGEIFHTYSTYGRGSETMMSTYVVLDIMPKGRNEENGLTDWVRHHDKYNAVAAPTCCH